jgi:hypothetical protein
LIIATAVGFVYNFIMKENIELTVKYFSEEKKRFCRRRRQLFHYLRMIIVFIKNEKSLIK